VFDEVKGFNHGGHRGSQRKPKDKQTSVCLTHYTSMNEIANSLAGSSLVSVTLARKCTDGTDLRALPTVERPKTAELLMRCFLDYSECTRKFRLAARGKYGPDECIFRY